MAQCWLQDPLQRPTFQRIFERLRSDGEGQPGASTTTDPAPGMDATVNRARKQKSVFTARSPWLSRKQQSQSESPRGRRRDRDAGFAGTTDMAADTKADERPQRMSASSRRASRRLRRRRSQSESPLRSARSGDTAAGSTARSLSSHSYAQAAVHSGRSESKADLERAPSMAESRSSYWDSDEGAKSPGPGADGAEPWRRAEGGSDASSDDVQPGRNLIRLRSAASTTFAIEKNASSRSVAARGLSDSSSSDSLEDDLTKSAPATSRPPGKRNASLSASERPGSRHGGRENPRQSRASPPSYWDIVSEQAGIPGVSRKPAGGAGGR